MKQISFTAKYTNDFFRFLFVGILNTCVGYFIFWLFLIKFTFGYGYALVIAYLFGIMLGYFLHKKISFRKNYYSTGSLLKFVFLYLFLFLLNLTILFLIVDVLGVDPLVAQIFGITIVTLISFLLNRNWVFANEI